MYFVVVVDYYDHLVPDTFDQVIPCDTEDNTRVHTTWVHAIVPNSLGIGPHEPFHWQWLLVFPNYLVATIHHYVRLVML